MPLASFRDPAGFCFLNGNRVIRGVAASDLPELESFLQSAYTAQAITAGNLVSSRKLSDTEIEALRSDVSLATLLNERRPAALYEHPRVPFASYPYEWPPEMLAAAAELTLELALKALSSGYGLKDATPYNVLFQGPKPLFIDLLSFEPRHPNDPIWLPGAQFDRTFLLPLMAAKYWNLHPSDIFTAHRDGLEPESLYHLCGPVRRWLPPFLGQVTLPVWFGRKPADARIYQPRREANPEKARFILEHYLGGLRRTLRRLQPEAARSTWSGYAECNSYNDATLKVKETFVRDALTVAGAKRVLDIGANTGHFSRLAAGTGASVVAVDYDAACVGRIFQRARSEDADILPLVVNLARPTPAIGWRNGEGLSFLDRARGAFDSVLMLAVLHHLCITERIPLAEVMSLAAELTTDCLVIEWVGPKDAMFQSLLRGRGHLYTELTQEAFEAASAAYFTIERRESLAGLDRTLYLLRRPR